MTINPITSSTATASSSASGKTSLGDLDQGDFLRLMLVQMEQQDPFNPQEQTEMLAQMAQFSSLAGSTEMSDTLKIISAKLDTLVTAQAATGEAVAALAARVAAQEATDTPTQIPPA